MHSILYVHAEIYIFKLLPCLIFIHSPFAAYFLGLSGIAWTASTLIQHLISTFVSSKVIITKVLIIPIYHKVRLKFLPSVQVK